MNQSEREELIKAYEKRRWNQMRWSILFGCLTVIIGMPALFGYLVGVVPEWVNEPWLENPSGQGLTSPLGLTCFLAWAASIVGFVFMACNISDNPNR